MEVRVKAQILDSKAQELAWTLIYFSSLLFKKEIGIAMGLDTANNASLWKDRVALEMNTAILHSYQKHGVSIVDQHTVSEQFQMHFKNEMKERGGCPADWVLAYTKSIWST